MITYRQRLALILGQKQRQRSPTFPAVRAAAQYPLRDSGRLSWEHLIMKIRTLCLAEHAYVMIQDPAFSMDVKLNPGKSAVDSLRQTVSEMDQQIGKLITRRNRIESAIEQMEKDK